MVYPLIGLDDLANISAADYEKALDIGRTVAQLYEAHLVLEAPAGSQAGHTSAMWKTPHGFPVFGGNVPVAQVLAPAYQTVNRLRLASIFTGYSLKNVTRAERIPSWTDALAPDFEPSAEMPDWSIAGFADITRDLPDDRICTAPRTLGEVGWLVNGRLVNRDVLAYQERIALLHHSGILDRLADRKHVTIVEIGGGYGGLAYYLTRILPHARYYVCDLPLSLFYSATYLTLATQGASPSFYARGDGERQPGFTFVPSFRFDDLANTLTCDLAINTMSFAEMPAPVVERYASGLARMLSPRGVLFEQNFDNSHYANESFCDPLPMLQRHFREHFPIAPLNRWGRASAWSTHADALAQMTASPLPPFHWRPAPVGAN